ncbi:MAG TPA: IS5 family transposase [Thermomicrobiales bacterium]|nr:IS5 family transposase [Thermomicrobiales bacterium]
MTYPLVSEDLWEAIAPLLPKEPPKPKGGRPRVPDWAALGGIVFVLRTGCPWRLLPKELGCGSGSTCWRRLRDWQAAGVWEKLHARLLDWLGDEAAIDWSRASVDSLSGPGQKGGEATGPNPTDRGKPGSKYHLVVEKRGMPLAVRLSAANAHDATQLLPLVDQIPRIMGPRGRPGRPRKRPAKLHADKASDASILRRALRARGIALRIARRGIDSSERLGRHRWVVERTLAWLLGCRRLGVRYERRADLLQSLLHLACALVCVRFLGP